MQILQFKESDIQKMEKEDNQKQKIEKEDKELKEDAFTFEPVLESESSISVPYYSRLPKII